MLNMLRTPEYGGDTIFTSAIALYDKLSPPYQQLVDALQAVHTSEHAYVNTVNSGGQPFRAPVRRVHPLVRTHPVTNLKSLFYNPTFVEHLQGLNGQEALHTMAFLREHLHAADDLTVRWKWEPGSVAFWDNRVVTHRAIPGKPFSRGPVPRGSRIDAEAGAYETSQREGKRTAVFGERPVFSGGETLSQYKARVGNAPAMGPASKIEPENL